MFNLFGSKPKGYENINVSEFKSKMGNGAVVLDVRQPEELEDGSIPGYKMISMRSQDFVDQLQGLEKGPAYLVYCRSGMRSAKTCEVLAQMGHEELYNLSGGIMAWNQEAS